MSKKIIFALLSTMIIIAVASSAILVNHPSANSPSTTTPSTSPLPTPTPIPQKTVVICFDDGWLSQLDAFSILDRYGYKATLGIITSYVEDNYPAYMNWSTIENLTQQGYDIESHTVSHESLSNLTITQLSYELKQSQQDLLTHGVNSSILIYPYGDGYDNQTVIDAVSRYYQYARDVIPGHVDLTSFDDYAISASEVQDTTSLAGFANLVSAQGNDVTVLFYHKISYEHDYAVTPENFAAQMQYLHDNGFVILTMKQVFGISG
jgi:hypothetical protein